MIILSKISQGSEVLP